MFGYYLDLAVRSLRRNQVLTALMVLAIAVGIGASMTTLTVVHLLSGDPLPGSSHTLFFPQVDPTPGTNPDSQPRDMMDYRSAMDLWSAKRADRQALVSSIALKLTAPELNQPPLMARVLTTTADFFPMFSVPLRYGRAWTDEDDAKRTRSAVISADLNDKLFGGADSTGRTLRLNGVDVRIIGVLGAWRPSPQFYEVAGGRFSQGKTSSFYARPEEVFMPFSSAREIAPDSFNAFTCWGTPGPDMQVSPCVWLMLWVQLHDPSKLGDYQRFVAGYAAQQKTLGRFVHADNTRVMGLMQWLDFNHVVPSDTRLQMWLAFAFLLICLCNTVGLLLAKFLRRGGEIGLRRALGASRGAVLAQFLVEAGLIGLLGGVGGWLLTLLGLWVVRSQPIEYADLVHLDATMLLLTFALAVLASLLAGFLPALRASRVAPGLQLKTL